MVLCAFLREPFDHMPEQGDFLPQAFYFRVSRCIFRSEKPCRQAGRNHSEKAHARGHQQSGDDTAPRADRVSVTVADGGDRRERPPHCILCCPDIRLGQLLEMKNSSAGSDNEQECKHRGGKGRGLGPLMEDHLGEKPCRPQRSQHSRNAKR